MTIRPRVIATLGLITASLTGCAPPALLTSLMRDSELRTELAERFPTGMTSAQINDELDALNISRRWRLHYPATDTRPEVLLARLYPPGGVWPEAGDSTLEFVDVSFIFDDNHTLSEWRIFRDGVRYVGDSVINAPTRATLAPVRDFPAPIPPPRDPLEGTK